MKPLENGPPTDFELTEAIKNSDQSAFKDLFYRYYTKLFRFAVIHIHSTALASDLVQEVFFRLWETRDRLNPNKSIQAYLYKILHNLIINHLERASTKTLSLEDHPPENTFGIDSTRRSLSPCAASPVIIRKTGIRRPCKKSLT